MAKKTQEHSSLLHQAEKFQALLIDVATGGSAEDNVYRRLRKVFTQRDDLRSRLPEFVKDRRDASQFWEYIKHRFDTYHDRREFIWKKFRPLLAYLEQHPHPADGSIAETLQTFGAPEIQRAWNKALARRESDPDGAVTAARTLIETVFKHILDAKAVEYGESDSLPKLYKKTSKALNLAPSQHTEQIFKQILGGCTSVVNGLGALRNRLSDAHGKGHKAVKPAPRHAELAVNLAGSLALYLIRTMDEKDVLP